MAISYPLALPTHTGFSDVELRAKNAVAYSRSPFTFAGQAFAYSGKKTELGLAHQDLSVDAFNIHFLDPGLDIHKGRPGLAGQ